jgi:cytochrome c peroxidase
MKKICILALVTAIALATFSFLKPNNPQIEISNRLGETTERLLLSVNNWEKDLNQPWQTHKMHYNTLRDLYKSIETYVSYRYPELEKSLNGGPVPSIVTDVVILHKDQPHGLQVIEEILGNESHIDTQELKNEWALLKVNLLKLQKSWEQFPLKVWEIFDANHQSISRMMSLGLTGFDSPVFLRSIRDSRIIIEYAQKDLRLFENWGNPNLFDAVHEHLGKAQTVLTDELEFEELNRVDFYRNYLIPIQKTLRQWHFSTEYETYEETGALPRAIQSKALHLFDTNYLNPYFTMRGKPSHIDNEQIKLGQILFFDPILSKSLKMSCASCHLPERAFSDGKITSIPKKLDAKARNAPGLINSAFQGNFFWDLKSEDLNNQIMHVFEHANEFNTTPEEITQKLKQSDAYKMRFKKAFSSFEEPISLGNIKSALEVYVRSLNALNAPFDRYLRSETNTIAPEVINGANLFLGKAACATCHFAPIFNGFVPPHYEESEGEIIGVLDKPNGNQVDSDWGRFHLFERNYSNADFIKGMFKTPGIRNIQYTAPYMHNGAFNTLEEVMEFYNHGGALGKGIDWPQQTLSSDSLHLSKQEINDVIAFMNSLSDTTNMGTTKFPLPDFPNKKWNQRIWGGTYE